MVLTEGLEPSNFPTQVSGFVSGEEDGPVSPTGSVRKIHQQIKRRREDSNL